MEKLVMKRNASDNKYLHKDFHKSLDLGIAYIGSRYGDNGVKQYLREFAMVYYAPLAEEIRRDGLKALAAHIEKIYEIEEMPEVCGMELSEEKLDVTIGGCPALEHFKKTGYIASEWYVETTRTIHETIADMANLRYSQHSYDEATGRCEFTFAGRNA